MKSKMKTILTLLMALIVSVGVVSCGQGSKTEATKLEKLNWAEGNYKAITSMIEKYGKTSKDYDEKNKPYAVFDWDNTTIMNDVEEALLVYQIENLKFKMSPEEMSEVLKTNIPKEDFVSSENNLAGQPVNIDKITADIVKDYTVLYNTYEGLKGQKKLEDVQGLEEYTDFKAKLRYLYHAIGESFSSDVSYPWVTYLFKGMTSEEVAKLTEASNDYWLKQELAQETWKSSEKLPGEAGVVEVTFERGLRTVKEMQNLYATLKDNGIDVYICSASYIDVVKEFATNPKFGYNIDADKVFAMVLNKDKDGIIQAELNPEYFQTQGKGKTQTIEKFIAPKYNGAGPIMVGGDSNGDYEMLSDFKDTKISLIINRLKSGKIGELCQKAIDTTGKDDQRFFLQGRNNNTGEFIPTEKTILLNSKEEKLTK